MISDAKRDRIALTVKDGFLICPRCQRAHMSKKIARVNLDTTAHRLPVYCRNCKLEIKVDIVEGECFESRSQ